ncbi:hypothetical protein [Desulfospira joergensenii]|uniref:hypothetical protein n=1 Tax=Desulfospira joergensenii TaxID=53329 RepID=UPI0003B63983|nr:hypothetical protein [Desulfospira joergensenii]
MSLKDFRSDDLDLPEEETDIPSSDYHQEINTLKIDKLSNRVTIISIIIPVLIIAILVFAYMDMKEQVLETDEIKKNQMDLVSRQLEEKVNALDIRIAKNRFDFDQQVPELTQKGQTLANQVAKMETTKADDKNMKQGMDKLQTSISGVTNRLKKTESLLAKLDKRIQNNAAQNKSALETMERINTQLQDAIGENNVNFKKAVGQVKEEIQLFKEEFDARLLELAAYDQEIALLRKDLSLLDKKIKEMESSAVSTQELNRRLTSFQSSVEKMIQNIDSKNPVTSSDKAAKESQAIKPKLTIDTDPSTKGISEETLTQ